MALTTAAVVGAAATVKGAIDARKSSKEAASAQIQAAKRGEALTEERFEAVREGLQPFISGAGPAFEQQQALSGALGPEAQAAAFQAFQEDPGTGFLREQGLRLIETGAAATGGTGGGERLRELTRFSQGLALQDLSARFNRLGAVTGTGLQAAQALGGVSGTATAGQVAQIGQGGAAQALGTLGAQQATSQGIQQLVGQIPGLVSAFQQPSIAPMTLPAQNINPFARTA